MLLGFAILRLLLLFFLFLLVSFCFSFCLFILLFVSAHDGCFSSQCHGRSSTWLWTYWRASKWFVISIALSVCWLVDWLVSLLWAFLSIWLTGWVVCVVLDLPFISWLCLLVSVSSLLLIWFETSLLLLLFIDVLWSSGRSLHTRFLIGKQLENAYIYLRYSNWAGLVDYYCRQQLNHASPNGLCAPLSMCFFSMFWCEFNWIESKVLLTAADFASDSVQPFSLN